VAKFVAVDLTSLVPAWLADDGRRGRVYPSFCLPWFRGEPAVVGEGAARHRRGSMAGGHQSEARYDPRNPSRRPWAEGWLALNARPDSLEPSRVELRWRPPGERAEIRISFAEVVRQALCSLPAHAATLGLVVPAGLGPGPRESLLETLGREWEKVWFFPRTVAAALDWCSTIARDGLPKVGKGAPSRRAGSLLVVTGAADLWEVARVPIRIGDNGFQAPCPIHDRTDTTSETAFIGIAETLGSSEPGEAWRSLLSQMLGEKSPEVGFATEAARREVLRLLGASERPERASARTRADAHRGWRWLLRSPDSLLRSEPLLGVLLAGPWRAVEELPTPIREGLKGLDAPHYLAGADAPLRGVAEGLARLQAGMSPFFEALAPLQLHYQGTNAWRDPVSRWLDLLQAQTEVPVGRVYETPEPIRGLSIPPGREPTLELVLRGRRQGTELLRGIREPIRQDLARETPVLISARIEPGRGLARVVVRSAEQGVLDVSIREDRAEPRDREPPVVYGWPPGSAWLVSHEVMVNEARHDLERLVNCLADGRDLDRALRAARQSVNKWMLPGAVMPPVDPNTLSHPPEIHPLFVYLSVFPGDRRKAHPVVEPTLQALERELPHAFDVSPGGGTRTAILWFASWLYARCPEEILDFVRDSLRSRSSPEGAVLAVAGNCFHRADDYRLFFDRLDWFLRNRSVGDQYWVRAWRNLARFRHDALSMDVLPADVQDRLVEAYLDVFAAAPPAARGNSPFLHCCYLAPHMLKRRRFDRRFLDPDSSHAKRFARILEWAHQSARSKKHQINVACAQEFLDRRATYTTLQELSETQGA